MAFKMKNSGGPFKMMGSSSPMKAAGYVKPGGKATGKMADYPLNSQARRDEYDARGWAHDKTTKLAKPATKAKPVDMSGVVPGSGGRDFESTDASNRQATGGTGSQTVKNRVGGGSTTYETSDDGKTTTVTKRRKDGSVKKTSESVNRSTWDPKTQTGSSGLGMQTTTTKRKKDGSLRGKQKTTYSMGTDTKKDDKVVKTRVGKRKQTTKVKNADLHSGGKGTSKTKHYTRGKKAGTSVTRERKKGQLFGRKVDVDYS